MACQSLNNMIFFFITENSDNEHKIFSVSSNLSQISYKKKNNIYLNVNSFRASLTFRELLVKRVFTIPSRLDKSNIAS